MIPVYRDSLQLHTFVHQKKLLLQLPSSLIDSLQNVKGFDEEAFKKVHQSGDQVTSIRFNPAKHSTLNTQHTTLQKVPWSSQGYYLSKRPSFTSDPLFHAGLYYVQEASSMFLEEAIRQTCDLSQPLRVLDLCAAPGGKSTLIQSIISADSLLVSNELIKTRVNILSENITKWGAINIVVTNNDPRDFQRIPEFFDLIVVDAPCSGSGLFRKDPAAIDEWSLNNVALCSQRQQRILADILPALKSGGILIYSTCSYSEQEDEEICDWLLSSILHPRPNSSPKDSFWRGVQPGGQHPVSPSERQPERFILAGRSAGRAASSIHPLVSSIPLQLKSEWNIFETISEKQAYGYRFYPDKLKGEGFFIAAFRKEGIPSEAKIVKPKNKPALLSKKEIEVIEPYFNNMETWSFFKWQEQIIAVPSSLLGDVLLLQSSLYIKKAGINIGTVIRDELIPDHEFALSNQVADAVASIDVDGNTALQYLRRQDLGIDTGKKGWAIVKFQNTALGWVKILANRINNYYPKSWRILNK